MDFGFAAVFLLVVSLLGVNGFPDGAPSSTCSTMLPVHGDFTTQNSRPPYQITTSSTTYSPGQSILVTISATGDGNDFAGFLLRAENSVGTFSVSSDDARTECSSAGVTHTNKDMKSSASFTWTAPASKGTGTVTFVATVVRNTTTFWTDVQSAAITESSPGETQGEGNVPKTTAVDEVDTSGCETTKACFRVPDGCTAKCDYILTWRNVDHAVSFEMSASASSNNYWVSFGLSHDEKMGDDSVVDCVFSEQTDTVVIQASHDIAHSKSNEVLSNPKLGLVPGTQSGSVNNDRITCRFQRLRNVAQTGRQRRRSAREANSDAVFSLDAAKYYILMAKGEASRGIKQYHKNNRVLSASSINITGSASVYAGDESWRRALIKSHGSLMLIAWMVCASFSVLMPRYCKQAWPNSTWYGKKIWFQIHQPCMVASLLLTAVAFVIVFLAVCGYSQLPSPATAAHPPLGIVVMALVIINPIMAMFRPEPTAKMRPVFNVLHFLVGTISHLAAVVTMFLGLYMPQLALPTWCRIVMVVYICFHAAVEMVLAIHLHASKCRPSATDASGSGVEMQTYGSQTPKPSSESPTTDSASKFKTVVLVVHLCGVVACCAAIVVQIGAS